MKKSEKLIALFYAIVFISFSNELKSQGFEGEIIYRTTVERPENSNIPKEQFEMMFMDMDTIAIFYLKNNRYKLVTLDAKTNKPKTVNLFEPESNKSYGYMAEQNDFCMVGEMKIDTLTKPKISTDLNDTLIINGKKCCSMIIDYGAISKTKIYYSEDYKVNVESIKDKPFGFLEYIYRTGALPLKIVMSGNGAVHNMVFTAIEVKEGQLSDKLFIVPEFKQIMNSPF